MDSIVLFFKKRLSLWNDKISRVFCTGFSLWNVLSFAKNERSFREYFSFWNWCMRVFMLSLWNERKMVVILVVSKRVRNPSFRREGQIISKRGSTVISNREQSSSYQNEGETYHFKMRVLPSFNLRKICVKSVWIISKW